MPAANRINFILQFTLALQQSIHLLIAHRFGKLVADGIELVDQVNDFLNAFFDVFSDRQSFL